MSILKGIFDEIKEEFLRELGNNKSNNRKNTLNEIESILGINKNESQKKYNRNVNTNKISKSNEYYKKKNQQIKNKESKFNVSFEDKHGNNGYFGSTSKSTSNKSALTSKKSKIEQQDISYYDMVKDESKIKTIDIEKTPKNSISKIFKNKDDVKNAFVASIIFERKI